MSEKNQDIHSKFQNRFRNRLLEIASELLNWQSGLKIQHSQEKGFEQISSLLMLTGNRQALAERQSKNTNLERS